MGAMGHRFIAVLLSATTLFLASAALSCPTMADCPMMKQGRMDCCRPKPGVSTPACCGGAIGRAAPPAAMTSVRSLTTASAMLSAPAVDHVVSVVPVLGSVREPSGFPVSPGGPLVAQHTSLVL